MIISKRIILLLSVFLVILSTSCHKKSGGYNPFLHDKVKPSQVEAKRSKNADKKAARAYKKQLRRTSMKLYNRKPGPSPEKK